MYRIFCAVNFSRENFSKIEIIVIWVRRKHFKYCKVHFVSFCVLQCPRNILTLKISLYTVFYALDSVAHALLKWVVTVAQQSVSIGIIT